MPELTDWRGTEIKVGSHVVYAVAGSTTVSMVEAVVESIGEETDYFGRTNPVIKARRVDYHTYRHQERIAKDGLGKTVRLTRVDRLVVIPPRWAIVHDVDEATRHEEHEEARRFIHSSLNQAAN